MISIKDLLCNEEETPKFRIKCLPPNPAFITPELSQASHSDSDSLASDELHADAGLEHLSSANDELEEEDTLAPTIPSRLGSPNVSASFDYTPEEQAALQFLMAQAMSRERKNVLNPDEHIFSDEDSFEKGIVYRDQPTAPAHKDAKDYEVKASKECPICRKKFKTTTHLRSHLLTHAEEKPFQCAQCSLSFARKHDLKRHERVHSGIKAYVCPRCGRGFARKDGLNRHMAMDPKAKKVRCKPGKDDRDEENEND